MDRIALALLTALSRGPAHKHKRRPTLVDAQGGLTSIVRGTQKKRPNNRVERIGPAISELAVYIEITRAPKETYRSRYQNDRKRLHQPRPLQRPSVLRPVRGNVNNHVN